MSISYTACEGTWRTHAAHVQSTFLSSKANPNPNPNPNPNHLALGLHILEGLHGFG